MPLGAGLHREHLQVAAPSGESRATRVLAAFAWLYLVSLVAFAIVITLVGERTWVGALLLYVPRLPLLLPLLICVPLVRHRKRRKLLGVQAAVATAVVLVLSGPHLSFGAARSGGPTMRLISYNVWYARRGVDAIEKEIDAAGADVIVLQATNHRIDDRLRERLGPTWHFDVTTEFFLASRYPIVSVGAQDRRNAFRQYTLDTPLGMIDLYNIHPYSPRSGINELRGESKRALAGGPSDEAVDAVENNTQRRERQLAEIAAAASASVHPVVIAGDSNLPEWSTLYRRYLAPWQDGFSAVGTGFGYTFPANKGFPWMRIDRVLAGPELRFTSFTVGGRGGSDHCPVWVDLEKR